MTESPSQIKEAEMEELYRHMATDELEKKLNEDNCIDRRRLIRKELRGRKNTSSLQRAVSQVRPIATRDVDSPVIVSARVKTLTTQPSIENTKPELTSKYTKTVDVKGTKSFECSSALEEEENRIRKELHDTTDLNRRRELRGMLKEVQAKISTKLPSSLTPVTVMDVPQSSPKIINTVAKTDIPKCQQLTSIAPSRQTSATTCKTDPQKCVPNEDKELNKKIAPVSQSGLVVSKNSSGKEQPTTKDSNTIAPKTEATNSGKIPIVVPQSQNVASKSSNKDQTKAVDTSTMSKDRPQRQKMTHKCKLNFRETEDVVLKYSHANGSWDTVTWFYNNTTVDKYPQLHFHKLKLSKFERGAVTMQFSDASVSKHRGIYRLEMDSDILSVEVTFEVTIEPKVLTKREDSDVSSTHNSIVKKDETPKVVTQINLRRSATFNVSKEKPFDGKSNEEKKEEDVLLKKNINRVTSIRGMFEVKPATDEVTNRVPTRKIGMCTDMLAPPTEPARKLSQVQCLSEQPSPVRRRKSSVNELLLGWSRAHTTQYKNVTISNFSSSWADGLAFCALIHHFFPESFDYTKLTATNRRHNFNLAFETASSYAGVDPLLDTEDMMSMDNPDWKCVYTYIQHMYSKLKTHPKNLLKKPEEPPN